MTRTVLGIIGGSGIYAMDGLSDPREERIASPWGDAGQVGEHAFDRMSLAQIDMLQSRRNHPSHHQ